MSLKPISVVFSQSAFPCISSQSCPNHSKMPCWNKLFPCCCPEHSPKACDPNEKIEILKDQGSAESIPAYGSAGTKKLESVADLKTTAEENLHHEFLKEAKKIAAPGTNNDTKSAVIQAENSEAAEREHLENEGHRVVDPANSLPVQEAVAETDPEIADKLVVQAGGPNGKLGEDLIVHDMASVGEDPEIDGEKGDETAEHHENGGDLKGVPKRVLKALAAFSKRNHENARYQEEMEIIFNDPHGNDLKVTVLKTESILPLITLYTRLFGGNSVSYTVKFGDRHLSIKHMDSLESIGVRNGGRLHFEKAPLGH